MLSKRSLRRQQKDKPGLEAMIVDEYIVYNVLYSCEYGRKNVAVETVFELNGY